MAWWVRAGALLVGVLVLPLVAAVSGALREWRRSWRTSARQRRRSLERRLKQSQTAAERQQSLRSAVTDRAPSEDQPMPGIRQTRRSEPWVLRHSLFVFAVGTIASIAVFTLAFRLTDRSSFEVQLDSGLRAATASAAAALGLLTWSRLELSRQEHRLGIDRDLTERYGRAIDQIGSSDELVRVGGIFALERFALDAARVDRSADVDWHMALGMLAALARRDSPLQTTEYQEPLTGEIEPAPPLGMSLTTLEAVQAIGRFAIRSRIGADRLPAIDLADIVVPGALLRDAGFRRANLSRSVFRGSDLRRANLEETELSGANLSRADMSHARMTRTRAIEADLAGSRMVGVLLLEADLTRATMRGADLTRADLTSSIARNVDFTGAILNGANLWNADLAGADMRYVRYDDETIWPHLYYPSASA